MEIGLWVNFFKWSTILNAVVLALSAIAVVAMPKTLYKVQKSLFKIKQEQFNVIVYGYLGLMKLFLIFFNLVPLLALCLVGI